jgi:hypothetical protein
MVESIMDFELFGSVEFINLKLSKNGEETPTYIYDNSQQKLIISPTKRRRDCEEFFILKINWDKYNCSSHFVASRPIYWQTYNF